MANTKPTKALVAGAFVGVSTFVAAWVADTDPFTSKEVAAAAIAAVAASGLAGSVTWVVKNKPQNPET